MLRELEQGNSADWDAALAGASAAGDQQQEEAEDDASLPAPAAIKTKKTNIKKKKQAKTGTAAATRKPRAVAQKPPSAAAAAAASSSLAHELDGDEDAEQVVEEDEDEDDDDASQWQSWEVASAAKFDNPADEADFQKWAAILAQEEAAVDKEMEDEMEAAEEEEEHEEGEEDDEDAQLEAELAAAEAAAAAARSKLQQRRAGAAASSSLPATASAAPAKPAAAAAPKTKKASAGEVSNGVRMRMLSVGGEQVMELTGVDDADVEGSDAGSNAGVSAAPMLEWEGSAVDLSANDPALLEADDPDAQVGRGVGGVFFARKDILELSEKDLVESFTKGSGRGGQKVNKTNSCVNLLHLPTGTRVKCQFSRELAANRARARTLMRQRLEEMLLGAESRTAIKAKKERKKKDRNRRRRAAKHEAAATAAAAADTPQNH